MKKFISVLLLICLLFVACETGNNNEPENNSVEDWGIPLLFCNEETNIAIFNEISNNRSAGSGNMTYRIVKKGKGEISSGNVSLSSNKNSVSFSSKTGKTFDASISQTGKNHKLTFSSSIPTDVNTTESIGSFEGEVYVYVVKDTTDFAYLLNVGSNAFEIGYQNENGIITFFRIQSIGGTSAYTDALVSLGNHNYLFYRCNFVNGNTDSVNVLSKHISNWVPPYTDITYDTFMVASGKEADTKGILTGSIDFEGVYEKIEISQEMPEMNRLSMLNTEKSFIYTTDNNAEYPYLLWGGGGFFKLGKMVNNVVSFLPIRTIGATSHDGQIIHQPEPEKYIYVVYDFADFTYESVNVFISGYIPGSYHYLNFSSIKIGFDANILNNTIPDDYSYHTYNLVTTPINWIE